MAANFAAMLFVEIDGLMPPGLRPSHSGWMFASFTTLAHFAISPRI
jgi:hypothetical protein